MKRLLLVLTIAACGGRELAPETASSPECAPQDDAWHCGMAAESYFLAAMCACHDQACVIAVEADIAQYRDRVARMPRATPTADFEAHVAQVQSMMMTCRNAAVTTQATSTR
jgi:hypothetical protein